MLTRILAVYSAVLTTAVAAFVFAGVALSFDRYGGNSQFVQLAGVRDSKNHIVGRVPSIAFLAADGKIVNQLGPRSSR